jgi:ketosteroid isomerase-like protein
LSSKQVVLDFVERINSRDVEGLVSLMSEEHKFIDGLGSEVHGKSAMRAGWTEYYKLFPDYRVEIETILEGGEIVALFGKASATFAGSGSVQDRSWRIPAAWRAIVKNGFVSEWQVYADYEPVWKVMGVKRY